MNFFGFGDEPLIEIKFNPNSNKDKLVKCENKKTKEFENIKVPLYKNYDDISGKITIKWDKRKKLDHYGIKVSLIGEIIVKNDKIMNSVFVTNGADLESAGTLYEDKTYNFNFPKFQKQYESYYGNNIVLRYYIKASIIKKFSKDFEQEQDFYVLSNDDEDKKIDQNPINIEVGIDKCLNILINFPKNNYHLKDVVQGIIEFSDIKLWIKRMELTIIRKEILGTGKNADTKSEELHTFEIMDGCPVSAEKIPVRLFLSSIPGLTKTMESVNNKFSVKYLLNVCIYDEQLRKYFKPSEIKLYRNN